MICVESNVLAQFLIDHNLSNTHCTVHINKNTLSVDYLFVDDVCTYQLTEDKPRNVYFDKGVNPVFSFNVPNIAMFLVQNSIIKLSNQSTIVEITCDKPRFSGIVKSDDNHTDLLSNIDAEYINFAPYGYVRNAIRNLKAFANELSTSIMVEFGESMWTVSVSQCCIFGAATGLKGMISSQLFEKIFDPNAEVSQTSPTSITVRKRMGAYYYIIRVPISSSAEMPRTVPTMVRKCNGTLFKSKLTEDVGGIVKELSRNVKKENIQVMLTDGRLDVLYSNSQMSLTTAPRELDKSKNVTITVPVKALNPIVYMLEDESEVRVNGDIVCLMKDKTGLLISGIVSLGH